MHDDKDKQDQFDDFDFDTFDDIEDESVDDDLVVEADSLDTDLIIDDDLDAFNENADWEEDTSPLQAEKPKKSANPSAKILLPAVLGLIALGGAGYYLLSGSSPAISPAPADDMTADAAIQADSSFPSEQELASSDNGQIPMPAPIAMPENTPISEEASLPLDNGTGAALDTSGEQSADVLTPMPNAAAALEVTDSEESITAELDLETPDTRTISPVQSEENVVQETAPEASPIEIRESTNIEPQHQPTGNIVADVAVSDGNPGNPQTDQTVPTDNALISGHSPAIHEQELAGLEAKLSDLESAASEKDRTIQSLNERISALQKSLEASEKKASALSISQSESTPQPETKQPSSAPAPKKAQSAKAKDAPKSVTPATAKPPKSAPEAVPKWELRSAQPGKAYIGIVGSSEVLVVKVGDTIQGVGRITSIAKSGSKWVVSGTKGEIVR